MLTLSICSTLAECWETSVSDVLLSLRIVRSPRNTTHDVLLCLYLRIASADCAVAVSNTEDREELRIAYTTKVYP